MKPCIIYKGILVILILFSFRFEVYPQKEGKIIILHTNDMHSKIDNMGKLAYLADSLRRTFPYVYLVASGDNFTGNPVVDMIRDKGYPMIDLMNRCGFSVSAVGNHEFDMGQKLLGKRIKQAQFPFISCNIRIVDSPLKPFDPVFVITAGDMAKIAFVSAIELNEDSIPDTHPSKVAGLKFTNGVGELQKYAGEKDKYGILIALTHLGIEDDITLAKKMPQLDMIMGGHSHTLIDTTLVVNGVRITQAGANLNYIGKTTLDISNGRVTAINDEIIPVKSLKKTMPGVQEFIDKYNDVPEFRKVVGIAEKPLNGYDELGSLMTDAVRDFMKTDIALQNKGGIRVTSLDSGQVTLKDIYKLDPFGNSVVVFRMKKDQIAGLIKYGYELEKGTDLQVSGMKYRVTADKDGKFQDVSIFTEGSPDSKDEYIVAMNGYMAAAYKFEYMEKIRTSEKTTSDMLISYLKKKKSVNYSGVKRIDLLINK